jgi:hypothetical protein
MPDPSLPIYSNQPPNRPFTEKVMLKRRTPAESLQRTIIGVLVGFGFSGALGYGVGRDIWLGFASST